MPYGSSGFFLHIGPLKGTSSIMTIDCSRYICGYCLPHLSIIQLPCCLPTATKKQGKRTYVKITELEIVFLSRALFHPSKDCLAYQVYQKAAQGHAYQQVIWADFSNGVKQPFQTQNPNTPRDWFRKEREAGAQGSLSYQLFCHSLGFLY